MIQIPRCPVCHEVISPDTEACPACYPAAEQARLIDAAYASPTAEEDQPSAYSIVSLLLGITLLAVGLGLTLVSPVLGIFVLLLVTPALVRTMIRVNMEKERGRSLDLWQRTTAFLGSLGIVLTTGIAVVVTFCVGFAITLVATLLADLGSNSVRYQANTDMAFALGVVLSGIAALACAMYLFRRLWPIRLK